MGRWEGGRGRPRRPTPVLVLAPLLLLLDLLGAVDAVCTAGYLKLDLLSVSGGGTCTSNLHALCLPSLQVGIAANCSVTLTPALGTYGAAVAVPAIWSTQPSSTYARLQSCPTVASAEVVPAAAPNPSATQLKAAVQTAFQRHIYGSTFEQAISATTWSNGTLSVVTTSGSCTLKYAITLVSPSSTAYNTQIGSDAVPATCDVSGTLVNGADCMMNVADPCAAGKAQVALPGGGNACAVCQAGSYSSGGISCTSCSPGYYAGAVGSSSCSTQCAAGTYATRGSSACWPCNPGTYQGSEGQSTCTPCPYRSYAHLPGATQCVRCVAGIPKCVTGSSGGCDSSNMEAPSAGYQVVSVSAPGTLRTSTCALPSQLTFANPPLFGQCGLAAPNATWLSLYVDQYCRVALTPMKDAACAEPGASYWNTVNLSAYYVTPTLIATRLNLTGASSSYLLTLVPAGASTLTLSYWPATTDLAKASNVSSASNVCTGTATVIGGQVDGVPTSPATCPAGSYDVSTEDDGCRPCPVGTGCNAGATSYTSCAADYYQPYLGQPTSACTVCNATASPRYTANSGDAYCLVPWVDTVCTNGYQYDSLTTTCTICPAGTQRKVDREDSCVPCSPGYYSAAGATDCTACPVNQAAFAYGTAERSTGTQKCSYCPVGSVATLDDGTTGQTGSTDCSACSPGTIASITAPLLYATCQNCADGYYRSGTAAANNNICKAIPPGMPVWQKEASRASATYTRSQLTNCDKGEVSFWTGSVRTPSNAETCQACAGNGTYSPRIGQSFCRLCPGGTFPSKSNSSLPGNDVCTACTGSTYRPATSTSNTCLTCTAGRETDGSSNTACTSCIPGFYMPDINGGTNTSKAAAYTACVECPANSYQPGSGQTSCLQCPAGWGTDDTANTACIPCAYGYYSPTNATNCIAAPRGTYVNRTGATTYTPCPLGTFSDQIGSDSCDVCGPGQYSNALGAKTCKTCPAGTASSSAAITCRQCSPGFFAPSGSSICSPCKPGTFASASGSSTCKACSIGSQCPTLATKTPQLCPRGYFSSKEGAQRCTPCAENTYQNVTGQKGCKPCSQSYYTRGLTGQSACQPMRTSTTARVKFRRAHL